MEHDRDTGYGAGAGADERSRVDSGLQGDSGFGSKAAGMTDDAGTRAGSYDGHFTGEPEGGLKGAVEEGRERVGEAVESGKERVGDAVDSGRHRIADQLETLGDRLEDRGRGMEDSGGIQRRAGHVALRAGEALDTGADYIRSHDVGEMRDDLERAIRDRPLFSVGVAVGAGFLLGRLLRD
jgi:ElaB/YqjD/DUF883 family membrane-anchored ribosome-binding protein